MANRAIDDAVVQILSKVCRARLVIIATHNANNPILMLGGTALLLACDVAASHGIASFIIDRLEDAVEDRASYAAVVTILSEGCHARPGSVTIHHAHLHAYLPMRGSNASRSF